MQKKVCLILVMVLLITMTPVFAKDTVEEAALSRIYALGIMVGDDNGDFRPEETIIRSELAAIAIRILGLSGIEGSLAAPQLYFTDVAQTHWAAGYIAAVAKMGLMQGKGNYLFSPDENVTYEQAIKVMVSCLGYDSLVTANGAWYDGYLAVADKIGLLKSIQIQIGEPITRLQLARMIDNALDIEIMAEIGDGKYEVQEDTTLLTYFLMDGAELTGIVEANHLTGILDTPQLEEDEVIIDGYVYHTGTTNAADLLGMQVSFFAQQINGQAYIRGIYPVSNKNLECSIVSDDISKVDGHTVFYQQQDGKNEEHIYLSDTVFVVYNDRAFPTYQLSDLGKAGASLRFLDNDGDGRYDIIFVKVPDFTQVLKVDSYDGRLYLKNMLSNGRSSIDTFDMELDIQIRDSSGNALSLDEISQEDTPLEIYADNLGERIVITKLDKVISGIPQEIQPDKDIVTIVDEQYYVYRGATGSMISLAELDLSTEYAFTLDTTGRIVYAEENKQSDAFMYGYICDVAVAGSALSSCAQLKVLFGTTVESLEENDEYYIRGVEKQKIEILKTAEKLRIDDERTENAILACQNLIGTVVRLYCNGNNEVTRLETLDSSGPYGLRTLNAEQMILGNITSGAFGMNEESVVFFLPKGTHEDDFYAEMKFGDGNYECQGLAIDEEEPVAGVVVFQTDIDSAEEVTFNANVPFCIVQGVSKVLDENGDVCYRISGYENGQPVDLYTNPSVDERVLSSIYCGAVVRFRTDFSGRINAIQKIETGYDRNAPEPLTPDSRYYTRSEQRGEEQVFGIVTEIQRKYLGTYSTEYENRIMISTSLDGSDAVNYPIAYEAKTAPYYYVYDHQKGIVTPAEFTDIFSINDSDLQNASRVFLYMINSVVKIVVIVR